MRLYFGGIAVTLRSYWFLTAWKQLACQASEIGDPDLKIAANNEQIDAIPAFDLASLLN
jgi:hypothetical protein